MSDLRPRVISALVLGIVVLGATLLSGWPFALVATLLAMAVWSEWMDVAVPNSDDRIRPVGFAMLAAFFVASLIFPGAGLAVVWVLLTAAAVAFCHSLAGGRLGAAGLLYAGTPLVALIMLRQSAGWGAGLAAVLFLFVTVWATDIGAYFAGRHFGGPKLAPAISPNKTWSGAIGGVLSACIGGIIVFVLAGRGGAVVPIALAFVLSVFSQGGDLFESWIKRRNGVKDSSRMIPGHGGVMDRVDGLVVAAVVLWVICVAVAGLGRPAAAFFA